MRDVPIQKFYSMFDGYSCTNKSVINSNRSVRPEENFYFYLFICLVHLIFAKYQSIYKSKMALNVKKGLFFTIYLLSTAIIVPLLFLFILLFAVFREIVSIILRLRYGLKFQGIMRGSNTMWAIENEETRSIINTIMVIEPEDVENFAQIVKQAIFEKIFNQEVDIKLLCTKEKFMGYNFLLHDDRTIDFHEYCRVVTFPDLKYLPQNQLQEIISNCSNAPMPRNNKALWECIILEKPLQWSDENKFTNEYGILFRIHHSLADGFSLVNFLSAHFSDAELQQRWISTRKNNNCSRILNKIYNMILGPAIIILEQVVRRADVNPLHGPVLSGRKIVTWAVEDVEVFVPIVKEIKNKIIDCTFMDVILAGISASISEYLQQKDKNVPKYITSVIPAMLKSPKEPDSLENNFTVAMMKIPTFAEIPRMTTILKEVQAQTEILRNSPDFAVNRWLLTSISSVFPEILLKPLLHSAHSSMVISNLPGTAKMTIFNGALLKDIVFWIPNRGTTGLGLSILSYDNRFQMGLMVDKSLLSEYRDANFIIYGIFKYILKLHREICKPQINIIDN